MADQVLVIDCSKGPDEEGHATYRELTVAEQKQRDKDVAAAIAESTRQAWLELRRMRDRMLVATDHYERDARWKKWRQALRDLPANTTDPETPKWPKPPTVVSTLVEFRALWPKLDWTQLERGS